MAAGERTDARGPAKGRAQHVLTAAAQRARMLAQVMRDPARRKTFRRSPADIERGLRLHDLTTTGNVWRLDRELEDMDPRLRFTLGASLLQDSGALLVIEGVTTWFTNPSPDEIVSSLLVDGGYSTIEIDAMRTFLASQRGPDRAGFVVDIGANIGTTSVPFALAGYHVVAIEPVPRTAALLRRNIEANGVADRCTVVEAAIAVESSTLTMRVGNALCMNSIDAGSNTVDETAGRNSGDYRDELIEVPAQPLEHILDETGVPTDQVALVWSDTEGGESAVLASGERLWGAGVPLWVEVSPSALDALGGVDTFSDLAIASFGRFCDTAALLADPAEPALVDIGSLPRAIADLDASAERFTNVLLVP